MKFSSCLSAVVLSSAMAPSALAQEASPADQLTVELHAIAETTRQAVALLQELNAHRAQDLELRRLHVAVLALQLRSAAIGDTEARIQTLRDRLGETKEYSTQMSSEIERLDQLIAADTTSDDERTRLELERALVERQIDLGQQRAWSLEQTILDLENDLVAKKRDLAALEEIVTEGLADL